MFSEINPRVKLLSETVTYTSEKGPYSREIPCGNDSSYMSSIIWKFEISVDRNRYCIKIDATNYVSYNVNAINCKGNMCGSSKINNYCTSCNKKLSMKRPYDLYNQFYNPIRAYSDISDMKVHCIYWLSSI